jgi:hypothetical protein
MDPRARVWSHALEEIISGACGLWRAGLISNAFFAAGVWEDVKVQLLRGCVTATPDRYVGPMDRKATI